MRSERGTFKVGMTLRPAPGAMGRLAQQVEAAGFDILLCSDTQNLAPEVHGSLMEAALTTSQILLGPGVTNPVTRTTAVTASAIASLHTASGGRSICGFGRGDSAVTHAGVQPASVAEMATAADELLMYWGRKPASGAPDAFPLAWYDAKAFAEIPLDIACTGPRTIRLAADIADRVTFAVGAAPERVAWAMSVIDNRLKETGRQRSDIKVGAYLNAIVSSDLKTATDLIRPLVSVLAHFPAVGKGSVSTLPTSHRSIAGSLRTDYDAAEHGDPNADHLALVDDDFVEWFALVGDARHCRTRLADLLDLGLDHIYLVGPIPNNDDRAQRADFLVEANSRFLQEVVMPLRGNPTT